MCGQGQKALVLSVFVVVRLEGYIDPRFDGCVSIAPVETTFIVPGDAIGRRRDSSYHLRRARRLPFTRQTKTVIVDIEESEASAGLASGCVSQNKRLVSPFIDFMSFDRLLK